MVYLFFLFSLVSPFLFISPKNFHAPFQKGVFLFVLFLTIYNFWKEKKSKPQSKPNHSLTNYDLLSDKQIRILPYLLSISCILFIITNTIHAIQLSKSLAGAFLFQDADYIGISDILLSIPRGDGFTSGYYSDSGIGSYLHHHFAPGMFVLTPFVNLVPERWGLAVGVFFVYQLATILWLFWAYQISKNNLKDRVSQFLVFWVLLTNQLYLYRIGSSFHFEVLVLLFALFFFYIWEQQKKIIVRSHFSWFYYSILSFATILYLSLKEDIGIYLLLFFLPIVLRFLYKHNQKNRNEAVAKGCFSSSSEDTIQLRSLILIISILLLWMGFVFCIYPMFGDSKESITWANVLTQEYHSAFKQVTGFQKSFQIFLELITSGGLGIFQMLPEVIGIGLVYGTHIFSSRPWHHEVYTYYSYSLVPFILYTGILWIQSEKKISLSFAFLILTCLFWKNSLDQNFPLDTNIKSPWKQPNLEEFREDLKKANLLILTDPLKVIPQNTNINLNPKATSYSGNDQNQKTNIDIFVFSQYNLSFQISDKTKTYPLEQIRNAPSICKNADICFAVMAPEFTDEILWPQTRILSYKKELEEQKGSLVWKGNQIEVWQIPTTKENSIHRN
ncbi:DUF2079 domain-containing protein [Leptospira sp. mixed culture ATI2-C-A1]|nr:DUF2079 domain-containing protein [Leptospira sp. mixed culture ATI2-C-A1]